MSHLHKILAILLSRRLHPVHETLHHAPRPTTPRSSPRACLLDHLIRLEEERRGDREAERLGRLEVDDQLERSRPLHGQVGRLRTFQDLIHIAGGTLAQVSPV